MTASVRPVAAAFAVFGSFAGAWAVVAVDVERQFGLSDAQLGLLLAAGVVAATGAAGIGGAVSDRIGAGRALSASLFVWALLLLMQAIATPFAVFAPAFVGAVAIGGFIDVVMNIVAAAALGHEPGRLVRLHGAFNAGCLAGALLAGMVVQAGGSWRVVWAVTAVVACVTACVVRAAHLPEPRRGDSVSMWRALAGLRHEGIILLAVVFAASAMVEGGLSTWGVLYLRADLGVGVLAGVGAYVVGQSLATATRFGSSGVIARVGGVTAMGYFGMVVGPPLVGALSDGFGLRWGLVALAATALFVAVTPARVRVAVPEVSLRREPA